MVKVEIAASDVRAYDTKKRSGDGTMIDYEQEAFATGIVQSSIDFELLAETEEYTGRRYLTFEGFAKLIRSRETDSSSHSDTTLKRRFLAMDGNKSGRVEVVEFVVFSLRDALRRSSERVVDLFRAWDRDGSGEISRTEFGRVLSVMGFACTRAEADETFNLLTGRDESTARASDSLSYETLNERLRHGAGSAAEVSALGLADAPGSGELRRLKPSDGGAGPSALASLGAALSLDAAGGGSRFEEVMQQLAATLATHAVEFIELFRGMDTNGDGRLGLPEWRTAMGLLAAGKGSGDGRGERPGRRVGGFGQSPPANLPVVDALFRTLDADGSGSIEYRELRQQLQRAASAAKATMAAAAAESGGGQEHTEHARAHQGGGRTQLGMSSSLLATAKGKASRAFDADGAWGEDGLSLQMVLRHELARKWLRVRDLFRAWDTNGDGLVSREVCTVALESPDLHRHVVACALLSGACAHCEQEFTMAMRQLGLEAPPHVYDGLFCSFDTDCSGLVDFHEMHEALKQRPRKPTLLTKYKYQRTIRRGRPPMDTRSLPDALLTVPRPRATLAPTAAAAAPTSLPPIDRKPPEGGGHAPLRVAQSLPAILPTQRPRSRPPRPSALPPTMRLPRATPAAVPVAARACAADAAAAEPEGRNARRARLMVDDAQWFRQQILLGADATAVARGAAQAVGKPVRSSVEMQSP